MFFAPGGATEEAKLNPPSSLQAPDTGDLHVLAVGVEPDRAAKGKNDPYARDAAHIGKALAEAEGIYKQVHIRVIGASEATVPSVKEALDDLARDMAEEDLAFIHFSTHGDLEDDGRFYFSLAEPPESGPARASSLFCTDFSSMLAQMKGTVLVSIDACHAAAILPETLPPRVSYLVSCGRDESSYGGGPGMKRPHGYYIRAFLEALRGRADADGDGVITFGELIDYLPARATEMSPDQTAEWHINEDHLALPLARLLARRPH